jgi:hypothetical protein
MSAPAVAQKPRVIAPDEYEVRVSITVAIRRYGAPTLHNELDDVGNALIVGAKQAMSPEEYPAGTVRFHSFEARVLDAKALRRAQRRTGAR